MFQFTFKKEVRFTEFNKLQLDYLEKRLHERYVNILEKTSQSISYDVSFFEMNSMSLMCIIDHGAISVERIENTYYVVYKASYQRFAMITFTMALIMGIFSMSFSSFLLAFIILFGLNWIIAHLRHDRYFISIWKTLLLSSKIS